MIDTAYFLALTLIFIRMTAFLSIARVFFPTGTPAILKGALGMILSFCAISGIDYSAVAEMTNNYVLVMSILNEVILGLILGYITNLVFEVVKMAGAFMDIQIGLGMMNMIDPTSKTNVTLLANISYTVSMVIFFIVDGHHIVIKCLIQSFRIVPLGHEVVFTETFRIILDGFVKYFVLGVKIAIPMVLIIIITDLCMGLVSRTVPALNVMILGMPVKMLVGLMSFVALLPILVRTVVYGFDLLPDIFQEIFKAMPTVPFILIFASDDKTEEATPKKKSDAKKKGQVARSKDVGLAITMLACTLVIMTLSSLVVSTFKDVMVYFLQSGMLQEVNELSLKAITINMIMKIGLCIIPFVVPIMIAGIIGSIMQTGFMFTGEPLKPSLGKLNPISGFKNMFSKKSLVDLVKNLIVVTIVGIIGYQYVKDNYNEILQITNAYLPSLGTTVQKLVMGIFMQISIVLIVLAAIDYFVQYKFHQKSLKMSKQEVKDEYKNAEGDPQVKGKIKQKQREMATRRMMQSVADATVVITNPTHLAIAIKYIDGEMEAPKVIAKGADLVALKIKEIAKENNIPVMENKPLARLMYEQVEIDQDIPQDMYQAVAEVLAMVFKLKNK